MWIIVDIVIAVDFIIIVLESSSVHLPYRCLSIATIIHNLES